MNSAVACIRSATPQTTVPASTATIATAATEAEAKANLKYRSSTQERATAAETAATLTTAATKKAPTTDRNSATFMASFTARVPRIGYMIFVSTSTYPTKAARESGGTHKNSGTALGQGPAYRHEADAHPADENCHERQDGP